MRLGFRRVWHLNDVPGENIPSDHQLFFEIPFVWCCSQEEFEDGEIGWLRRNGSWSLALMNGIIEPTNQVQRRFVIISNFLRSPRFLLPHEKLWQKYLKRCPKLRKSMYSEGKRALEKSKTKLREKFDEELKQGIDGFEDNDSGEFAFHCHP